MINAGLAPPPGPPPELTPPVLGSCKAKCLYDFDAGRDDELTIRIDDILEVTSKVPNGDEDGWWMGQFNGQSGLFPASYVQEVFESKTSSLTDKEEEMVATTSKSENESVMNNSESQKQITKNQENNEEKSDSDEDCEQTKGKSSTKDTSESSSEEENEDKSEKGSGKKHNVEKDQNDSV